MKKIIEWLKINLKPINFLIGIIIGALIVNKFGWNILRFWKIEYNSIATDYLKILLGWPVVVLIILIIFFFKFSLAFDHFIRHFWFKYKDFEGGSQQDKIPALSDTPSAQKSEKEMIKLSKQDAQNIIKEHEELQTKTTKQEKIINDLRNLVLQFADRSEFFEFKSLSSYLVLSTKLALLHLNNNGPFTKDFFIQSIIVPPSVIDKLSEKFAIHNALLVNGLIEEKNGLQIITEKGKRYLKFAGLFK